MSLWNGESRHRLLSLYDFALSLTDMHSCGRNVLGMMQVIEQEMAWRKANGRPEGFEALRACRPLVALGAEHPLEEEELKFDHFRKSRYQIQGRGSVNSGILMCPNL